MPVTTCKVKHLDGRRNTWNDICQNLIRGRERTPAIDDRQRSERLRCQAGTLIVKGDQEFFDG
jgi:hypothetical protein